MKKPLLIYCYDAYCGWCYGFSVVLKNIHSEYKDVMDFEVLSGGMVLPEKPTAISVTAPYIQKAYKTVEEQTGIVFGEDYLWHIFNAGKSDWYPDSLKPAIALCIFKEYYPEQQVEFAEDLQYSLHYEGRDLTDDEAYRHLLEKYDIAASDFYRQMKEEAFKEKAFYEFALVKQLEVTGFPTVFLQTAESKFSLVARGYTPYDILKKNIDTVLYSITSDPSAF